MKARSIVTFTLVLFVATFAFADKRVEKRTIVVKDGKVISTDGEPFEISNLIFDRDLLAGGKRAFLGVSLVDLTPELREHYGAGKDSGVLVGSVEESGPAAKAGVRVGDLIASVDGKDVSSTLQLRKALKDKKEGDAVRLDVLRGRTRQTLVANVVEREATGLFRMADLEALRVAGGPGEWRTRISALPNCSELEAKIKALESKMKELEKKLEK